MFEATVSALCETLAGPFQSDLNSRLNPPYRDVVQFVLTQQQNMADYMRFPFYQLTLVFGLCGILYGGKFFHRLSNENRQKQIESWRNSSLSPFRDLVRFYESLTVLSLYSRPTEIAVTK